MTVKIGSASRDEGGSLPDRIAGIHRAITAVELAGLLAVSPITVYKMAKAGRLPSFRVGTAVRFDPRVVAHWLRSNSFL
jgi:excisionase family DNA binding protein